VLPEVFVESLLAQCTDELNIKTLTQPWPDEPMEHGYAVAGMDGLKEYMGDADDIVEFIGDSEVLITHLAPMSRSMLQKLPNLKLIAVSRGGPVNIDLSAAKEFGVTVEHTPGRNASAVAEFTLGAMLAETRNIRAGHDALKQGHWRGELYRVVTLLQAFGSKIIVHDPYVQLSAEHANSGVELSDLTTLLTQSDVVTLHARVTAETEHMMNQETFAAMKPGAIFINTARGPLVDYDALYSALENQHLHSAMLETFAVEPVPPNWPLLKLPNVTLTPHIAGASIKTVKNAADRIAGKVNEYLQESGVKSSD